MKSKCKDAQSTRTKDKEEGEVFCLFLSRSLLVTRLKSVQVTTSWLCRVSCAPRVQRERRGMWRAVLSLFLFSSATHSRRLEAAASYNFFALELCFSPHILPTHWGRDPLLTLCPVQPVGSVAEGAPQSSIFVDMCVSCLFSLSSFRFLRFLRFLLLERRSTLNDSLQQ